MTDFGIEESQRAARVLEQARSLSAAALQARSALIETLHAWRHGEATPAQARAAARNYQEAIIRYRLETGRKRVPVPSVAALMRQ